MKQAVAPEKIPACSANKKTDRKPKDFPVSFSFTGTAGKSAGDIQPIAGTEWSLLQLFPSEAAWQLANEVTSDERLVMLLFVVAILTSSGQFVYIIRRKAELGMVDLKDFPLLMHIVDILDNGKADADLPWEAFTYEHFR